MNHFDDLQIEEFSMMDFVEECWDSMHEPNDEETFSEFLQSDWDFWPVEKLAQDT